MKEGLYIALTVLALTSCNSNDSDSRANEANEKKIEQQATGISDDAKKDAKQTANGLVELASMAMTEYELSQIAVKQATNPEVRSFAQQALNRHAQEQKEVREVAQALNITLPTELSKEGRDRVDDLREEKPGTAFDLKYLEEIGKVHDKAADVADDLGDEAPNDAVRTYATRVEKEDKERRDRAKSIRNVLN